MNTPIASTPFGDFAGLHRDGVNIFKGIRYAHADRFRASELATDTWSDLKEATTYGPQALQVPGIMEQMLGESKQPTSEDCLSLNVFTSGNGEQKPVIMWIHGGAFTNGGGSVPWYDGSNLVRAGNVVVVTINYRLGAFGFRGRDNAGLSDQISALEWVRANIESFGGDPSNVTIMGESAGGASVVALQATPMAADLFAKAFAMSPSIPQYRTRERADENVAELLAAAKVDHPDDLVRMSADALLEAQSKVLSTTHDQMTAFAPAVDDHYLPDHPSALAALDARPLVIGTNRDEMHLYTAFDPKVSGMNEADARGFFRDNFGSDDAYDVYARYRPDHSPGQIVSALQTDGVFRRPAHDLADARHRHGHTTFAYWFTFATPVFDGVLGSCHALDIPFALRNLDRNGVEMFTGTSDLRTGLAENFSNAVLDFARSSEPGWSTWGESRVTQILDTHTEIGRDIVADPEPDIRRCWEQRGTQ